MATHKDAWLPQNIDAKVSQKDKATPLTTAETKQLQRLEATVEEGLDYWFAVGKALTEICETRPPLYRAEYDTFREYVEKRWKMNVRTAYQLQKAVVTAEVVKKYTKNEPEQTQIVAMESLTDPQIKRVVKEKLGGKLEGVTIKHIKEVVAEVKAEAAEAEGKATKPKPLTTAEAKVKIAGELADALTKEAGKMEVDIVKKVEQAANIQMDKRVKTLVNDIIQTHMDNIEAKVTKAAIENAKAEYQAKLDELTAELKRVKDELKQAKADCKTAEKMLEPFTKAAEKVASSAA